MESRNQRFKRLAVNRVNNAIKQVELVGNLSNKSLYEYSDIEIKKIFSELESSLRTAKSKFKVSKSKDRFQL